MRISRSWLSDYVDFSDLSPADFETIITTRVAEVDAVQTIAAPLEQAVVGFVKEVSNHPNRADLKLATVNLGADEVSVVCGAPNIRVGMFVPYLAAGKQAVVLSSAVSEKQELAEIAERTVSGVFSSGILVSEAELGLSSNHQGLLDLTAICNEVGPSGKCRGHQLAPGMKLAELLGGSDLVLEIDNKSLTHRPDLWSHFGFAREIAAILGRKLNFNVDQWADNHELGSKLLAEIAGKRTERKVEIAEGCGCRRFAILEFANVAIQPSPLWMRQRLHGVGAGVRNLLVDLSNYVMHDIGQPNHAYDSDLLASSTIYIRRARIAEEFVGLDGEVRCLSTDDIVIADQNEPVALGGVIGGAKSSICDRTKNLVLESANFDPVLIRKTTKRLALRTDASNRFEKSLSAYAVPIAIQRFAQLLIEQNPSAYIVGSVVDCFPEKPLSITVPLRSNYIRQRLGAPLPDPQIENILFSLGFEKDTTSDSPKIPPKVIVPYFRATRDISIEEDLVEEVGRITGYESIPECAPRIETVAARSSSIAAFENQCQDTLTALGFSEVYQYSFMSAVQAEQLGFDIAEAIQLMNPVDATCDLIRTSLIPGMIELLQKNSRYSSAMMLYELGRVYAKRGKDEDTSNVPANERRLLCIGYVSGKSEENLGALAEPPIEKGADFYSLLGVVQRVLNLLNMAKCDIKLLRADGVISLTTSASDLNFKTWMHPFRAASISVNEYPVGVLAEVSPHHLIDCNFRAVIAEIDIGQLIELEKSSIEFKPVPKYPDSFFEMSIVMPQKTYFSELEKLVRSNADPKLLKRIEVLAVYQGPPLKADQKSISVKLHFSALDRTLSGEELKCIQEKLIQAICESEFKLRS